MRCILPISTALALLGCSGDPLPTGPNVLLLTVDTLRADMTEPYGDAAPISPALQELAAGAVVFEEAWSGSSWTLPSLASLHTGLHSSVHGAWQFSDVLGWDFDTLAERLTAAGWDTAAVVNHVFLGRKHGLNQGFVHYDDELVEDFGKSHEAITSDTVSDRGIAWLEAKASADDGRPWFLWLHYFDPHEVYQRHDRYAPTFGDETDLERYRGEIAWTDEHLGRVLASLETLGLAEDTVVVLTADHGEEWEEHGGLGHGHTLYGELVRVPLVIRAPGVEPARIAERVSTLDVAPTVL
ncbi:MAG: sulfatase, partial [Planctomycetota bacterium]